MIDGYMNPSLYEKSKGKKKEEKKNGNIVHKSFVISDSKIL